MWQRVAVVVAVFALCNTIEGLPIGDDVVTLVSLESGAADGLGGSGVHVKMMKDILSGAAKKGSIHFLREKKLGDSASKTDAEARMDDLKAEEESLVSQAYVVRDLPDGEDKESRKADLLEQAKQLDAEQASTEEEMQKEQVASAPTDDDLAKAAHEAQTTQWPDGGEEAAAAADALNAEVDQHEELKRHREHQMEVLHAQAAAARSDAQDLQAKLHAQNQENDVAVEAMDEEPPVEAPDNDSVAAEIAVAKHDAESNQATLDEVKANAIEQKQDAERIELEVDQTQKEHEVALKKERNERGTAMAGQLMTSVKLAEKEAQINAAKMKVLDAKTKAHAAEADALQAKQDQVNLDKKAAKMEQLNREIEEMEIQKSKLEAENAQLASETAAEQKSHKIASIQTAKEREEAGTLAAKSKLLTGELKIIEKSTNSQTDHLRKVETAAKMNTKVQGDQMGKIKDDFDTQTGALEDRIMAMKRALATKVARLAELSQNEKTQHDMVAKRTGELQALTGKMRKQALANKGLAADAKAGAERLNQRLQGVVVSAEKSKARAGLREAKVRVEANKVEAIKKVEEEAQDKSRQDAENAKATDEAAEAKIGKLEKTKASTEKLIGETEKAALETVKAVAHLKIEAAPHHKRVGEVKALLDEQEAKKNTATNDLKTQTKEASKLKKKVAALLNAQNALERRLPQSKGEMSAMNKAVETRKAEKAASKLKALKAVTELKETSAQFAKIAPEAVAMQTKAKQEQAALTKSEDEIASLEAQMTKDKAEHARKMAKLNGDKSLAQDDLDRAAAKAGGLQKEAPTLMAKIELVKQKIAEDKLKFEEQQRQWAAASEAAKAQVAKLGKAFSFEEHSLGEAQNSLSAFKAKSVKEKHAADSKYKTEKSTVETQRLQAQKAARDAEEVVKAKKKKVADQLKATIAREKKMEEVREAGVKKMEKYAEDVNGKMKKVLGADAAENAKTAAEEGKLKTELSDIKAKEAQEQSEEKKRESEVKMLEMKEVAAAKEGKEAVSRNVNEIIKVEGGKVDGEIALVVATENKEKRQIARLASNLKSLQNTEKGVDSKTTADDSAIDSLRNQEEELGDSLHEAESKLSKDERRIAGLHKRSGASEKEKSSLEASLRHKKSLLSKIVASEGADSQKATALKAEIAADEKRKKKLEWAMKTEEGAIGDTTGKLGKISQLESEISSKLAQAREDDLAAKEAVGLEAMKLKDQRADLERRKALARQLGQDTSKLDAEEAALEAKEKANRNKAEDNARNLGEAELAEHKAKRKAKLEALKAKAERGELSEAEKRLQAELLKEQSAGAASAAADAKKSALASKLAHLVSAEHSAERKQQLHSKVSAMLMKTEGLMNKSPAELKRMVADMKGKLMSGQQKASELARQKRDMMSNAGRTKQEARELEARMAAERAATQRQIEKDEEMTNRELASMEKLKGESDAEFEQRKRLRGETLREEKALARAKASREAAMRAQLAADAAGSDLKGQSSRLRRKVAGEAAEDQSKRSELAKLGSANSALEEKLVKEKVLNSQRADQDRRVNDKLAETRAEKAALQKKLSQEEQTAAIARTAADSEDKMLASAQHDLTAATARGKAAVSSMERKLSNEEEEERQKEMATKEATSKANAAELKETTLKEEIARKKEELKQEAMDLEEVTRKQREVKGELQKEEERVAHQRKSIADIKSKADSVAHTVESRKTDLTQLQGQESKTRAGTLSKIKAIKMKIAEAEAKKASSEEAIKQLNANIAEVKDDTKNRSANVVKLKSKMFSHQKELDSLKKKVSVLKAFLTGPIIGDSDN
jgi:hypothetical protein